MGSFMAEQQQAAAEKDVDRERRLAKMEEECAEKVAEIWGLNERLSEACGRVGKPGGANSGNIGGGGKRYW